MNRVRDAVVGIDPGKAPTICVIRGAMEEIEFFGEDQVSAIVQRNNRSRVEPNPFAIRAILDKERPDGVFLEKVQAMPPITKKGTRPRQAGLVSTANFVGNARLVEGIIIGLNIPCQLVLPNTWKKAMGLSTKAKDYSRMRAMQLAPQLSDLFMLKKDHDRAEAFLLCLYGYHQLRRSVLS